MSHRLMNPTTAMSPMTFSTTTTATTSTATHAPAKTPLARTPMSAVSRFGAALLFGLFSALAQAAPTVSLSAPANAAQYLSPATLTVSASATPSSGTTISKVEFYQGATLIGTDTTKPYSISWANPAAGTYSLTAKATDNTGAVSISAARTVTVNATNTAPTVSLTAPANNAKYLSPAIVILNASANGVEINTPITQVEFLDGSTVLATLTAKPYTFTWENPTAGVHSLTVRATDSSGAVTTSAARTMTVNATNTPPTISLTAPANNASVAAATDVILKANVSAPEVNDTIAQVEFYQGTTLIGTATASPWQVTWVKPAAGVYTLTAKATDGQGASTTSAARKLTVSAETVAKVYYLHTDHLDTPRVVTDETNKVVWRNTPLSEPFGNATPEEDPDGDNTKFSMNLRFPGQYYDKETNLNYNYFRDYNPATGRYIESDPIGLEGGINTYGYVGANPIFRTDPSGLLTITAGGSARLPGWLKYVIPGFIGSGGSAGIAIQVTKNGSFCPDIGPYWSLQGGGTDFGIGKGSLDLGVQGGGISDLAGRGFNYAGHWGMWGGTANFDWDANFTGAQVNWGPGFYGGGTGSFGGSWSVRGGLSPQSK